MYNLISFFVYMLIIIHIHVLWKDFYTKLEYVLYKVYLCLICCITYMHISDAINLHTSDIR